MKNHFKQTDADSVRISVHDSVGLTTSSTVYGAIDRTVPVSLEFNHKYITRNAKLEIFEAIRWDIEDEIWNYEFPENKF